jgi:hypothetical protein
MSGSVPVYYTDEYSAHSTQSWIHDVVIDLHDLPEPPPGQHWEWFPYEDYPNLDVRGGSWGLEWDYHTGSNGGMKPTPESPSTTLTVDSDIHLPDTANLPVLRRTDTEFRRFTEYAGKNPYTLDAIMDMVRINRDAGRTVFAGTEQFLTPPAPTGFALPTRPPNPGYIYAYDIGTGNWAQVQLPGFTPPRGHRFVLDRVFAGQWFLFEIT